MSDREFSESELFLLSTKMYGTNGRKFVYCLNFGKFKIRTFVFSGPSLYIKRANLQNISSVSSSLKHFYGESRTSNNLGAQNPRNYEDIGTLDRNFFTNTNFNYDNHLMFTDGQEGNSLTNASNSNKR